VVWYRVPMLAPLLALALLQQSASASESGTSLSRDCQAHERIAANGTASGADYYFGAHCVGYIDGFIDGILVISPSPPICPVHASMGTMVKVYLAYVQQHPVLLDKPAYEGLFAALSDAYPCEKGK